MKCLKIPAGLVPNLDCQVVPEQPADFRADFKELAEGFKQLASYAEGKENAMRCRLDGKIAMALRFESAIEVVYNRLPDWAKW